MTWAASTTWQDKNQSRPIRPQKVGKGLPKDLLHVFLAFLGSHSGVRCTPVHRTDVAAGAFETPKRLGGASVQKRQVGD